MMNAHVETLRELRVGVEMDALYDPAGPAKLAAIDAAIAALEAQGEALAWHLCSLNDGLFITDIPPSPAGTDIPPDWGKGCGSLALNVSGLSTEQAQAIVNAHNVYLASPSSPAMRAVVEALKEIATMSELSGDNITDARIAAKEALAHPEVKKLMGEGNG